MALVKIYKGEKSLLIPHGAYKYQYAPAGWELSKENSPFHNQKDELQEESENSILGYEDEYNESEEEISESFDEIQELEEKPLSELSIPELRILADYKGVDTTGLTSAKKLRDAIKAVS